MTGRQEDKELLDTDEEELRHMEDLKLDARDVLNDNCDTVDMRNKRATDMKGNRLVMMPGPAPPIVEAEYSTRMESWLRAFSMYKKQNCDDDDVQLERNLSKSQLLGLKTTQRKVAKKEIVVLEADKGKRFVVVKEETYIAMAKDHTAGDLPVGLKEIRESQRVLSATAKALANTLDLGSNHSRSNYERCVNNCGSSAHDVPALRILPKVHKGPGPHGHLQSRPVVAAAAGVAARAGDQLADFLTPLVAAQSPRMEDLSTEEVMVQLQEAQAMVRETCTKDVMVGSLDVRALYPSLDQEGSARAVADLIMRTPTKVAGIDWRSAQVFIASNMDHHELLREGIESMVPKRKNRGGKRPGKTTPELSMKKLAPGDAEPAKKSKQSLWEDTDPYNTLSDLDKTRLLATVMLIATRLVFKFHIYRFGGEVFRQLRGGPIGLRFTSIVARIVMDSWITLFLAALLKAGVNILGAMKYVDDINLVIQMLGLGTRWVVDSLVHTKEWEDTDRLAGRTRQDVSMEALRTAADSIVPWLEFT